jgi:hypothetical protein
VRSKFFLILSISVILLSACASPFTAIKKVITTTVPTNILTGLPGSNGPVLAVKIDDTPEAHPQIGLESADVVYIEQVEGGLTRLAAIYSQYPSAIPSQIGPVRSARISDLEILAQYGKVGFAFSGAQSKFYPKIDAANLVNLSADRQPSSIYSRDATRRAPTNLILNPEALLTKTITKEGTSIDSVKSVGWNFGDISNDPKFIESNLIKRITEADLVWPASSYQVRWSATLKKWLVDYRHQPDLVASGSQISVSTVVVQIVPITISEYVDKLGGVTPFSNTVGSGLGYLLRDGRAIPITWTRTGAADGTTFRLMDGSEAKFAPSQIWVALCDKPPTFIYPPAPTPTK